MSGQADQLNKGILERFVVKADYREQSTLLDAKIAKIREQGQQTLLRLAKSE
jgi:uncharacterized protein YheU (UPF0270 family)